MNLKCRTLFPQALGRMLMEPLALAFSMSID